MGAHHDTSRLGGRRLVPAALLACLVLAAVAALGTGGAGASPTVIIATKQPTTLGELQQAADRVDKQIAALDDQLEVVVEDWNGARGRLDAINTDLGAIRLELARRQGELDQEEALLAHHLVLMYKLGDVGLLDTLLGAGDLTEAEARVQFFKRLGEQDRAIRDAYLSVLRQVHDLEGSVTKKRDQAMAVQRQVDAERAVIEDKLAERQAILDGLDSKIKRILDQRARAASLAAGRLGREALAQIGSINGTAAQIGVVHDALVFLGVPYVWGGASPSGFDCSGLVLYVYARYGVTFPHFAAWQAQMGTPVSAADLQPADLVFFGNPIHHVVIYAGNGLVVQAPHTGDVVKVSRLSDFEAPSACRRYSLRLP
jgi:cell wall-associated NlpC family hydrolase